MRAGRRVIVVFLAAVLTLAAASSSLSQPSGRARDDVNLVAGGDVPTFNPLFAVGMLTLLQFTSDVVYDQAWRLVPQGVEAVPSIREGTWKVEGDTMTLVWRLKPRRWHDGRPVTCADYVFTFNVLRNEQVPKPAVGRGPLMSSVSCDRGDGRKVTVRWAARSLEAATHIVPGGRVIPRHVVERFYRISPSTLNTAPYGTDPGATIGDGPYRLVEWRRGQVAILEAVPGHPIFGTPRIRRIVRRLYRTVEAAQNAFLAGEIDMLLGLEAAPGVGAELRRRAPDLIRFVSYPTLQFEHIDFNLDNPLLRDIRVRRALTHAINRAEVWRSATGATEAFSIPFRVAHTYLPPLHRGHPADAPTYPYDPDRARRLLREAGFAPGPDGVLRNAAGERLSLELLTTEHPVRRAAIGIIQQQLHQVGVEAAIVTFPPRVFFDLLRQRRFKALAMYSWLFGPESGCDKIYTSDGIPTEANGWTGLNYPGYRNLEMDRLCKEAEREMDWERRQRLLQQTGRIFARDLPALPLVFPTYVDAVRVGLENFKPNYLNDYETWNAYEWYWK